ncbi:Hemolysins and related proteins containing CBS domains [Richelia intracellularis HM01]|uniref:hemolysin family protein n=1 Tax=Richelia intracellularis TaxID=1164990 RepID=UPI0002B5ED3B|nr:hemolysin family protein [Richelia intracellularis]CCH65796.1 Hemolysins and related proteins containing CBS domains [Richelia intracellularis HM01]
MIELLITALTIILGSATCAMAETALFSVPRIKVQQLAQSKKPGAEALLAIRKNMNRPIATIVILNNIFNIVGAAVIGILADKVLGQAWVGVVTGIMTLLIIIFGEIVPKTIGERYAQTIAVIFALPVRFLTVAFIPLVWLVEKITLPFTRSKKIPTTNEAEIRFLATIGYQEGVIEDDEAEMIHRVFQLNDLTAADVMSPRITITYLHGDCTLGTVEQSIISSQHSRILVVKDSLEQVLGLALKHELLTALIQGKYEQQVATLIRPVHFVPEMVRLDKLLKNFQDTHEHLVVVLDEYGNISGVVTLEDVLEVLTGEIVDETDRIIDLQEIARKRRENMLKSRGLYDVLHK